MYFQRWFYIMPICRLFFFLKYAFKHFSQGSGFWMINICWRETLAVLSRPQTFLKLCLLSLHKSIYENREHLQSLPDTNGDRLQLLHSLYRSRSRRCWLTWSTMRSFLRKKTWPFLGGNLQHAFSATLASMCTWSFATTFIHNAHGRVCMEHVKIEWLACEATYWYIYIYTLTHMYDIYIYIQYNIKAVLRQ